MSASNRNQNSANQNSTGEEVPLTAVTPAQDGNNSDQGTNKSQSEGQKQSTGNSGTGKDANDNADMYNPETALAATGMDIVSCEIIGVSKISDSNFVIFIGNPKNRTTTIKTV